MIDAGLPRGHDICEKMQKGGQKSFDETLRGETRMRGSHFWRGRVLNPGGHHVYSSNIFLKINVLIFSY